MAVDGLPMTLVVPSDLRALPIVRAFIEALCTAGRIDRSDTNAIVTATHEAVSNAIRHAHQDFPAARVELQCSICSNRIEIQVLDEGVPFDVTAVPELDPGELRIGGRGVYLMRTLMDEVSCRLRGKQGNILRMVKLCGHNSKRHQCG